VRGVRAPIEELQYIYSNSESVACAVETPDLLKRESQLQFASPCAPSTHVRTCSHLQRCWSLEAGCHPRGGRPSSFWYCSRVINRASRSSRSSAPACR
jgi:hypothetical protein